MYPLLVASSLEELMQQLDLDRHELADTIRQYNYGAKHNVQFRPSEKDGAQTKGINPQKSNWALPLDRPPYYALPLRTGVTFTYMGVGVDVMTRVLDRNGRPFHNLYAAGEIMAGNILNKGYLAGFGLTIGSVFGRLAGAEAAKNAVN
jgi:tricarballylate dehydrogenase